MLICLKVYHLCEFRLHREDTKVLVDTIEFSNTLHESILDVLKNVLGEPSVKAILFHLEPVQLENPKEFHIKLSSIFGEGAEILEKIIIKELFQRLNLPYEERSGFDFENNVEQAKEASEKEAKLR